MSLYVVPIDVPSQTRPRLATLTTLEVHAAVVDAGSVYFEDGCYNAVGVQFVNRGKQFAPFEPPGGWITGNDTTISWNEKHVLDGAPYTIEIMTCNMAVDHPHHVEVRLEIVHETIEMAIARLILSIDRFTAGVRR